jgi:hypothetical protein
MGKRQWLEKALSKIPFLKAVEKIKRERREIFASQMASIFYLCYQWRQFTLTCYLLSNSSLAVGEFKMVS